MQGSDLLAAAKLASQAKGQKRSFEQKQAWHAPWHTPPAHCMDLVNGRSKLESYSVSDFWDFMKKDTDILRWRTECPVCSCVCVPWGCVLSRVCVRAFVRTRVCARACGRACVRVCLRVCSCESGFAGDLERQGVAISRCGAIAAMACTRIVDQTHPLRAYLDATKIEPIVQEAQRMLPRFMGLVASEAMKKKRKQANRAANSAASMMMDQPDVGRPREEVAEHAREVHAWLLADSPLRTFLSAASDGAIFFTSNVHTKCAVSYVRARKETEEQTTPGVTVDQFVRAAQARLCD